MAINCSGEWLPHAYTVRTNEFFSQSANNCDQKQYRTVQEREQNTETNEIINKGNLIDENRILSNILGERDAYGILDCSYDSNGHYWTENSFEWEIFFEYNYVGSSGQFGGNTTREITYGVYKLSRGYLMEGNNYELCHYEPPY